MSSTTHQTTSSTQMTLKCSLSSCERQSRKRSVTFSREVMVRPFDASESAPVKDDLWYTSDEIQQQRKQDMEIVETIRRGAESSFLSIEAMIKIVHLLSEQAAWNIRGLEAFLDKGSKKSQNKLRGILAVLMEQDRQDMEHDANVVNISRRYKRVTKRCQEEAHRRAVLDRAAATAESCDEPNMSISCGRVSSQSLQLLTIVTPQVQTVSPRAA